MLFSLLFLTWMALGPADEARGMQTSARGLSASANGEQVFELTESEDGRRGGI